MKLIFLVEGRVCEGETCGASNATRFRFCPAIRRPQNVLRLTMTLGLSSVLSEFQANGWLGSWKGLAVGRGSSFGAIPLSHPSPSARILQVLLVALSYSVVALPWHQPKPRGCFRSFPPSWIPASGLPTCGSKLPTAKFPAECATYFWLVCK